MAIFRWTDPETGKVYNDRYTPIQRWRRAYQNDFQARMDWCVKDYKEANHNPIAAFGGDLYPTIVRLTSSPGKKVGLDASASRDPDNDTLNFRWFVYPEAGTYNGTPEITGANESVAAITIPKDAGGKQIHVILEVRDDNPMVPLYAYRRVVIDVKK